MTCGKCGKSNPDSAVYCGECGAPLSAKPQAPTATPIQTKGVTPGLSLWIIIGTIFVPLLGIIMGIVYLNDASPQKKAVGRLWLILGLVMVVVHIFGSFLLFVILAEMGADPILYEPDIIPIY